MATQTNASGNRPRVRIQAAPAAQSAPKTIAAADGEAKSVAAHEKPAQTEQTNDAQSKPAKQTEVAAAKTVKRKAAPARPSAPKPKVQVRDAQPSDTAAASDEPRQQPDVAPEAQPSEGGRLSGLRSSATGWVARTFPGHEHAFWGGVAALVCAILSFIVGPWRMLVALCLVVVGVALGQVLDGDPQIFRFVRSLFDNDRGEQ